MAAPLRSEGPSPYRGWIAGAVVIFLIVATAMAFWFRYHP